jgi:hypothetical protein
MEPLSIDVLPDCETANEVSPFDSVTWDQARHVLE